MLIGKIKKVFLSQENSITQVIVDGFMKSMFHMLCFGSYPCFLYLQYDYLARIGPNISFVKAKPDFNVLSDDKQMLLVIKHKTYTSATYYNNWKQHQVIAQLFVAVHHIATQSKTQVTYPVIVYAVSIMVTKFKFYKATATFQYIKQSAKLEMCIDNYMVVQLKKKSCCKGRCVWINTIYAT